MSNHKANLKETRKPGENWRTLRNQGTWRKPKKPEKTQKETSEDR